MTLTKNPKTKALRLFEEVQQENREDQLWRSSFAERAAGIREAAKQADSIFMGDPNDATAQARIDAHLRLNEADIVSACSHLSANAINRRTNQRLAKVVPSALKGGERGCPTTGRGQDAG